MLAVAALAACEDLTLPGTETLTTSQLLILPLQSTAPTPGSLTFWVVNNRTTTRRLTHSDGFNTLYVEVAFPPGCLASLNGTPVGSADSVQVTLSPRAGTYGVTVSPAGLDFASGNGPSAVFSFSTYADASVADGSPTYTTRLDYLDALSIWEEITPGTWHRVSGSGSAGPDEVAGALPDPGDYALAAPK